jgi:glycosyltransferase involved in cell wall biosynthesis
MKTILYIAPIYDGTGYAHMANSTILALDAAGYNVIPRQVKLCGQVIDPPQRVAELEAKPLADGVDVVIQNVLPPLMVRYEGMKNIGYFYCETSNFAASNWQYWLNLMDEVWVCSEGNKQACLASGVAVPVKVVHAPITKDFTGVEPLVLETNKISPSTVVFYNIGDFSYRKGMEDLIKVYLNTFGEADNVHLVLKTYVDSVSGEESLKIIGEAIERIKRNLRDRNDGYSPPITILPGYVDEKTIDGLHVLGDCYVSMERGAAWNIPFFEALSCGNRTVIGMCDGPNEITSVNFNYDANNHYIDEKERTLVYGMERCGYPGLYTSNEYWSTFSEIDFSEAMRDVYDVIHKDKIKGEHKKEIMPWFQKSFTISAVADRMKGIIDAK